jgi:hypothetical protein
MKSIPLIADIHVTTMKSIPLIDIMYTRSIALPITPSPFQVIRCSSLFQKDMNLDAF